jgi:hypothetical protein
MHRLPRNSSLLDRSPDEDDEMGRHMPDDQTKGAIGPARKGPAVTFVRLMECVASFSRSRPIPLTHSDTRRAYWWIDNDRLGPRDNRDTHVCHIAPRPLVNKTRARYLQWRRSIIAALAVSQLHPRCAPASVKWSRTTMLLHLLRAVLGTECE